MSKFEEAREEAFERAEVGAAELTSDFPPADDEAHPGYAVSVLDDQQRGLIVEVGTGPEGAYASINAYDDDEPAEPEVFQAGNSVMIVVEGDEDEAE